MVTSIIKGVCDMIGQNRYITILLLALTICMLLTACAYDAVNGEDDSMVSETANETTVTEIETDTTSVLDNETIDTTVDDSEQTTVIEQEPYDPEKEYDYLIHALKVYIKNLNIHYSMVESTYETKFDKAVISGIALYVSFDPNDYYFVCAYSDSGHEYEFWDQCCLDDYTWVRFDSEQDIVEYYNDEKFVVCFQINRTISCINLLSEDGTGTDMEHFQIFWPEFSEGINIAAPFTCDETYLYFYSNYATEYHLRYEPVVIYHSSDLYYHKAVILSLKEVDGVDCLRVFLKMKRPDGSLSENAYLQEYFGKYYDNAMSFMMMNGKHSVTEQDGTVYEYGLLKIDDVTELMKSRK